MTKYSVGDFVYGEKLGDGGFGGVKKNCAASTTNQEKEYKIQRRLCHPNIIQCYGAYLHENYFFHIQEFAPYGSLMDWIRKLGKFNESCTAYYMREISKALRYCHGLSALHRDIKPDNIVLGVNWIPKICDFGCSVKSPGMRRFTRIGTYDYLTPEIIKREPYSTDIDIYCLGVLCYELLVGLPSFYSENNNVRMKKITFGIIKFPMEKI
ncbi:unnamed protein product [Leptidea sinapis]|uniref:Protein kinase domain-containing protein n=1 Tax=Leptidea sinapis TaxID=189913 RepID=A0A5E4R9U4_9NEOP|nr:unnamed protein product [Leptidea sinapis]